MLTFMPTPAQAIALSIDGTITDEDLQRIMDRLELAMAEFDQIDIYVETHRITGIQLAALASYMPRALPLFGKLKSFRRVAVVADQAWIRAGTRVESALLPFISYRVFEPEQRDEALGWVIAGKESDRKMQ